MNKPISKLLEYTLSIFDTALYRIFFEPYNSIWNIHL